MSGSFAQSKALIEGIDTLYNCRIIFFRNRITHLKKTTTELILFYLTSIFFYPIELFIQETLCTFATDFNLDQIKYYENILHLFPFVHSVWVVCTV